MNTGERDEAHATPCQDPKCLQFLCVNARGYLQEVIVLHSDGTQGVEHVIHRAMPSAERKEKLEQCFTWLRVNFCPLTVYQEERLRAAMDVK